MKSDVSATSEEDSFLDYYKGKNGGRNGIGSGYSSRKHSRAESNEFEDTDNSAWIHRDKLAKIESRELQEAGLQIGRHTSASRSSSGSTSRRGRVSDQQLENGYIEGSPERGIGRDQIGRLPLAEEEQSEEDERINSEPQTPEEATKEQFQFFHNRETPAVRPSTSRIPLPKNSPLPLPSSHIERDSPLPRSRNNSLGNNLEDGIALNKIRGRSRSGASQVMLDDFNTLGRRPSETADAGISASPTRTSPSKAKVPNKMTPISGARKTNNNRAASAPQKKQQRAGSIPNRDSPVKRPVSSGTPSRPPTSHNRPEGEAPWIATMYKPDPRLPQDQQILPTHAKRMMQEQWEKEGKAGALYDKDFRLVNPHEFTPPRNSTTQDEKPENERQTHEKVDEKRTWPLAPTKLDPETPSHRPSTSGTEHGGYKITPTVQSPLTSPSIQQRTPGASSENPRPPEVIRVPDPHEEKEENEKKKSGCACCVVM